ncbi:MULTISPECIES: ornithine cyclodeaminase family protein [Pseudomonas]|uniref:ornithine cyclodeaminase family protein n=1 Tax=Pseudomonas TaxID=286 RepID=UPI001CE46D79|nr:MULTISPECIES: ornithine cyclodeaminase [Pseudomonas]MCO7596945.1 ornithine cyclodeaminase [Pseudomonas guariconensis]MCO7634634.1 ornithine cyclodeaminase [Pseudomonas guariconensis]MCU7221495.1 ornithine cyclodeaminase [Pseudomonas brassicacearum]
MQIIGAEQINAVLGWGGVLDALRRVHLGPRPVSGAYFLGDSEYGLFSRGVVLPGQGAGVKIASIFPANLDARPPLPSEQAAFVVVDERTKAISAIFDGPAITAWKTAADSALAAERLSRPDSAVLLVLGAGPIARALVEAYLHIRPGIRQVLLWNRTASKLQQSVAQLQDRGIEASLVTQLDEAVGRADIIVCATSAAQPLVKGLHVRPGSHIDLVGGFRPDMREADSAAVAAARLFVDDRNSALEAGDLQVPLQAGLISEASIEADLFELCQAPSILRRADDITLYKNAGGAHLDLAVCQHVLRLLKG